MPRTATCLMFIGQAEEAMNLYLSLFPDSERLSIHRYGSEEPDREGQVMFAEFRLGEHRMRCLDSPPVHDFSFTPSTSLFIDCDSEEQLRHLHETLSEGGEQLMPLDNYGFSRLYAWINDRFGVSWQLNLSN